MTSFCWTAVIFSFSLRGEPSDDIDPMDGIVRRDGRGYRDEMVVEICYKKGCALRVSGCCFSYSASASSASSAFKASSLIHIEAS